ncbi:MAG: MmcQ/YjbR family DNA-binding protein [Balneolales bacterium]|nr:MmcQ/YjbR family DNA-binding protein [Balneolales bacterium]
MDIETYRNYCLSFRGAGESLPFDEKTLVFKVMGKIFSITDIDSYDMVLVKCRPEKAIELREVYSYVQPGYHMNKKHWNSIMMDTSEPVSPQLLREWIAESYALVVSGLTRKQKAELEQLPGSAF